MFENVYSLTKWDVILIVAVILSIPLMMMLVPLIMQGALWLGTVVTAGYNQPCLPCGGFVP